MTKKKEVKSENVYANVHANKIIFVNKMAENYTIPKLYIPKDKDGKATAESGKRWYVYYYFRNPANGNMRRQPFKETANINRLKTVKERKEYGKALISTLTELLKNGYSPYEDAITTSITTNNMPLYQALQYAFDNKKGQLKESTLLDLGQRMNVFLKWAEDHKLKSILVTDFKKAHAITFLNHIKRKVSVRTSNNYRSVISTLFTKLVDDDILEKNVWLDTKKENTIPKRNKPFTTDQVMLLKDYLVKNDPYLYQFLQFMAYSFLRPREVCRLKVEDIDTTEWLIHVETKTSGNNKHTLRVIETLQPVILNMNLDKYNKSDSVFTPNQEPGVWDILLRDKVGYFRKHFTKARKALELPEDCNMYSMRHTVAVNIYNGLIADGLTEREAILQMLPITRHANESGLKNYLREVNAFLPKDYSKKISIDF